MAAKWVPTSCEPAQDANPACFIFSGIKQSATTDFVLYRYMGSRNLLKVNAIDALVGRHACAALKKPSMRLTAALCRWIGGS